MKFRAISLFFATCAIAIFSLIYTPPAWALTQIKLSDLSYRECPAEMAEGTVTSGSSMEANCFLIIGKAENSSGKPVVNADIFGRIYDADENPVMQNRTRLGSIAEVPPGVSDFEIRISVSSNQRTPLKLKQFKATGFTGVVRR
ncbi:hypothetical protein [Microcoleus sp.]|uniref:hypothetical protein n=1 Tax=Microcoleus sp. TaxID=44472 RepID=UPI0035942574